MFRFGGVKRLVPVLLLGSLSACASIVSDNDSTTYIGSEPEGARCELHGQDFKRVITAPDSMTLPAEAAPITVSCKAEGYRTTTAELDTSMDGWIVGNLLFGGIIGVAVDAARGAGQKYPPQLTVLLDPESFDSVQARDEWYDRRRRDLEEKWGSAIQQLESKCARDKTELCGNKVKDAEAERDKEIEALEQRRTSAAVKQ